MTILSFSDNNNTICTSLARHILSADLTIVAHYIDTICIWLRTAHRCAMNILLLYSARTVYVLCVRMNSVHSSLITHAMCICDVLTVLNNNNSNEKNEQKCPPFTFYDKLESIKL